MFVAPGASCARGHLTCSGACRDRKSCISCCVAPFLCRLSPSAHSPESRARGTYVSTRTARAGESIFGWGPGSQVDRASHSSLVYSPLPATAGRSAAPPRLALYFARPSIRSHALVAALVNMTPTIGTIQ